VHMCSVNDQPATSVQRDPVDQHMNLCKLVRHVYMVAAPSTHRARGSAAAVNAVDQECARR
jgi:hypothetical protein